MAVFSWFGDACSCTRKKCDPSCMTYAHYLEERKPMTNADRIRNMSDEELAILFTTLISEIENGIMEKLKRAGVDADLIEFPVASLQSQLEYLQAEVSE